MPRIDTFLRIAADQRASDVHFHAGKIPAIRHLGDIVRLPYRRLGAHDTRAFLDEILTPAQKEQLEREQQIDFMYEVDGLARFRACVYEQSDGPGAVFRVVPDRVPSVDEIRVPHSVQQLVTASNGLVLVTGPTGSGKSTTVAALIDRVNRMQERHVLTIEDPIEYVHKSQRSVITQREVGRDASTFASALRSALREAPDVLLVGEVRDYDTVKMLLGAAEAGVLVIATLHTGSAAKAVDRLVGACPGDVQDQVRITLSLTLRGVVAQRLCKLATRNGRVAAMEVLLPSHAVAHLVRENKLHQIDAYLRSGEQLASGTRSLEHALAELVLSGEVEEREALLHANDPAVLKEIVAKGAVP
ncbi:type IV pilus twitching motility protein PilT [Sandaracinus amylolyticus]|uniref:Twitching motility protein PilT n=1 Tax=Sandaracinus amylolyticus TaxID=927083 RepID=A0A0F6W055_9BACT|nr:PilT/PilU family type 4a pilus ATPase [Sandaracinus amylolyticus]AKF04087.1 Twitching motility protein PilT [Sandaracinus amylolyticus]